MHTLAISAWILLAQSTGDKQSTMTTVSPSDISKARNEGAGYDLPWELLLIGIGATLLAIVVVSLRRWWLSRHADPSPMVLFSAIARKAGLGWRDRYLLWRISKTFDLPTPITLMLSKGTLRHYSDLYLNNHTAGGSRRNGARLSHIEAALFD